MRQEYGIYSTESGGLIYGIGFFDSEADAEEYAEYLMFPDKDWYLSTRIG